MATIPRFKSPQKLHDKFDPAQLVNWYESRPGTYTTLLVHQRLQKNYDWELEDFGDGTLTALNIVEPIDYNWDAHAKENNDDISPTMDKKSN